MHQSHAPQCTIQNDALWHNCLLYFVICEMCLLLKYRENNMNYEILRYKYPYIYMLTTLLWNTHNSMQPRDICGNKMVPVHQKDYCHLSGERTKLFTDKDFPSVEYNHWVSYWGWTALYVQMWIGCVCDQILPMFLKMIQYQTHKHYIADFLRSRSPSAK